jgi:peptidoglycan lytic transglycosylase
MNDTNSRRRTVAAMRFVAVAIMAVPLLAGCGFGGLNIKSKFSPSEYGVAASPRVIARGPIPKGGGRFQIGQPYLVAGRWYEPTDGRNYDQTGIASWYGPNFHGRITANGEIFDANGISAASPVLPMPSYARVTNLENGRSILVRINDRGPYAPGRIIDLSAQAASLLGFIEAGTAHVRVQYVGLAPLNGDDTRMLLASLNAPSRFERRRAGNPVQVASAGDEVEPMPVRPAHSAPLASMPPVVPMPPAASEVPVNLLSYADTPASGRMIENAIAATEAMASRARGLDAWRNSMDEDGRAIKLELGAFADAGRATEVAEAFALLGAVDQEEVTVNGQPGKLLTLGYVKPGVTRQDVANLVQELGLSHTILY